MCLLWPCQHESILCGIRRALPLISFVNGSRRNWLDVRCQPIGPRALFVLSEEEGADNGLADASICSKNLQCKRAAKQYGTDWPKCHWLLEMGVDSGG